MPGRESYRDVHHDAMLTNISIAFFQDTSNFIAGRFFPIIPVRKASDVFTTYPQGYFNRRYDTKRAEEAEANSISYGTDEDSYSAKIDALRIFISDEKRANVDSQRNLDMEATQVVTEAILLAREKVFVDNFLTAGKWSKTLTGHASNTSGDYFLHWSDQDGSGNANPISDPIMDVKKASLDIVKRSGGRYPNKALMTADVWLTLSEHPEIIKRINASSSNNNPAMVTKQAVAALFELDEILVFKSIENKASDEVEGADGKPKVDNEFMAEKTFLLGHVPSSAGLMRPVAGATFLWNRFIQHGANAGPRTRRYRKPEIRGEYIEVEMAMDQKLIAPELCTLFKDVV